MDLEAGRSQCGAALREWKALECSRRYFVMRCQCSVDVVMTGCMRVQCQNCKDQVSRRRAAAAFDRLEAGRGGRPVIYTVFTVPPALRDRYRRSPREWDSLRKQVWRFLQLLGARFALEATHPVGDENPNEFHPHFNFLWVSNRQAFLDVSLLQAMWAKLLDIPLAVAHTQYSHKVGKIRHWCRYVVRTFPGSPFQPARVRWFGKRPRVQKQKRLCGFCESPFRLDRQISEVDYVEWKALTAETGSDPPWLRETKKKLSSEAVKAKGNALAAGSF